MAAEERWYRFGKAEKSLDRVGCIAVGYMVALLLALAWYAREKNADRPISRTLRRLLRQQGIVMKVRVLSKVIGKSYLCFTGGFLYSD